MADTLPHTENGFAQVAAEQRLREQLAHDGAPEDSTTIEFAGRMSVPDEDAGSDPYNRTGRFRRLVR